MSISLLCFRGQHSRKTPEAPISPVTNSRSRPFLHKHTCNLAKHGPCARKARHLRFESPLLVGHLSSSSPHLFLSSGTSASLYIYSQNPCWIYMTVCSWPSSRADREKTRKRLAHNEAENLCKKQRTFVFWILDFGFWMMDLWWQDWVLFFVIFLVNF